MGPLSPPDGTRWSWSSSYRAGPYGGCYRHLTGPAGVGLLFPHILDWSLCIAKAQTARRPTAFCKRTKTENAWPWNKLMQPTQASQKNTSSQQVWSYSKTRVSNHTRPARMRRLPARMKLKKRFFCMFYVICISLQNMQKCIATHFCFPFIEGKCLLLTLH
jgi:hypothetical protein